VDSYLAALVAHDPAQVPIAADAKFVENVTKMAPGEGLWLTASEVPATFKIYVPDPVAGQVGFLGVMKETDLPVLLALRSFLGAARYVAAQGDPKYLAAYSGSNHPIGHAHNSGWSPR